MVRSRLLVGAAALACAALVGKSALAQCQRDTDCKGGRVCRAGQCADAPAPPPPAPAPPVTAPPPTPGPTAVPGPAVPPSTAAAPVPPPPPVVAACIRDTDCKGDRVCERGNCVDPRPAAPVVAPGTPGAPGAGAYAQPQAPGAAPVPGAAPGTYGNAQPSAEPGAPTAGQINPSRGFVLLPRVGLIASGGGSSGFDCEANGTQSGPACAGWKKIASTDYDDKSLLVFGVDTLFHVIPALRLGLGLTFLPFYNVDVHTGTTTRSYSVGRELALQGIVEGLIPAGRIISVAIRGQGGVSMWIPSKDEAFLPATYDSNGNVSSQRSINQEKEKCHESQTSASTDFSCKVNEGPFWGYTMGLGAGMVFHLEKIRLRGDLLGQYTSWSAWLVENNNAATNEHFKPTLSLSGMRYMLLFGVEI
jgi:hypothetical protein